MAGYDIDVTLNLAALGLVHAEGSACKCGGTAHEVTVSIDPESHELHIDGECEPAELDERALQALHEQAHPKGSVYAENCREPGCVDAWEEP